ncbi:gamma-glutamyl-gamma-aminobutyrate hydrolase family protein [uncultured Veillonella sp.]|uniref:gamma-glutamyl-gamma-aminobutyrate hydrolase family protein n=1 Tax=uncultured Veillonella sp. TaxID=159268 RepID=UPI00260CCA60|nr:gamma-glutamyl-gamma-aminobutyrate hydrolase family protein [uncultured Veillonella sp.]
MRLRIGITADTLHNMTDVINEVRAPFAPRELVEVIHHLGAIPIILPDVLEPDETCEELVNMCDGIILPGGPDIDPLLFGEEPIPQLGYVNFKRDIFEKALILAAQAKHKPLLGLCKGAQMINVALGGTVYQDLKAQYKRLSVKHSQRAYGGDATHSVTLEKNSFLETVFGPQTLVNSRHHQAIRELGEGLKVTALSADGVVEGIENEDATIVGVQWHPENMWREYADMLRFFEAYLDIVEESL